MMGGMELPSKYDVAEGPEGLRQVLEALLAQSNRDAAFAAVPHYVLYQLGGQKSLIKIDLSQRPFQFFYYDLLGRPANGLIKETIAQFLWEFCGEKEQFLHETGMRG